MEALLALTALVALPALAVALLLQAVAVLLQAAALLLQAAALLLQAAALLLQASAAALVAEPEGPAPETHMRPRFPQASRKRAPRPAAALSGVSLSALWGTCSDSRQTPILDSPAEDSPHRRCPAAAGTCGTGGATPLRRKSQSGFGNWHLEAPAGTRQLQATPHVRDAHVLRVEDPLVGLEYPFSSHLE